MTTLVPLPRALIPRTLTDVLVALATIILTRLAFFLTYRCLLDPRRKLPGPWHAHLSPLWLWYHAYIGDECTQIDLLHQKYGPVVRIASNEVSISDGAALAPVYSEKGGFLKAECYRNFDIEGHATIFSEVRPECRAVRSKAVLPLFSLGRIREGREAIEGCVGRFVGRLEAEAKRSKEGGEGRGVNLLNLSRSLALDAVSSYLFGTAFGGLSEASGDLSASPFVDFFVAFGRFFLLPPWLFTGVEMLAEKLYHDKAGEESSGKVGGFAMDLVDAADGDDGTYQARLLKAGISRHEAKIQVEDLIFAGTDSTGMNLSTLCWNLAQHPEIYQKLRHEVSEADAKDPSNSYNPLALPYLDAVLRETLRTSMANPTRFPRVVPPTGFSFTSTTNNTTYFIPPGTNVGLQPLTLHFNPSVYPSPHTFDPERWLNDPTPEMYRDYFPFGLGSRQCIARNLATMELALTTRGLARSGVLEGAEVVGGREVEILEWFNSKVRGERMELCWR